MQTVSFGTQEKLNDEVRVNKNLAVLSIWMHKQAISLRELTDGSGGLSLEFLASMAASNDMMDLIASMNRLNINDPAVFAEALRSIYRADCKRSRSARPLNRVEKMTLKDIYRNRKLCASFDNNLPKAVRNDLE
jgi:hypothetical protein